MHRFLSPSAESSARFLSDGWPRCSVSLRRVLVVRSGLVSPSPAAVFRGGLSNVYFIFIVSILLRSVLHPCQHRCFSSRHRWWALRSPTTHTIAYCIIILVHHHSSSFVGHTIAHQVKKRLVGMTVRQLRRCSSPSSGGSYQYQQQIPLALAICLSLRRSHQAAHSPSQCHVPTLVKVSSSF